MKPPVEPEHEMPMPRKSTRKAARSRPVPIEATKNKPLLFLVSTAILLTGLGFAYWSVTEIATLVTSLRAGAPVVETVSAMYLLPVLALAFLAVGTLLMAELSWRPSAERVGTALMAVLLATMLLICVFGLTGGIMNWLLMSRAGYELCDTRAGLRVSWTVWAKLPGGCGSLPAT
ncbi:hypothetical protein [Aureimonas psammosilenae]|uniref:hypothetical protein n=1 Tax=Aureimonas psammosilenae TaxID=2495496 RepID=UPI001F41F332|nr:hypothetical protein [Aureimonas psammosilenae]